MKLERRTQITTHEFVNEYVVANRPVIITDAMYGWQARTEWNPGYLDQKLGDHDVQIYNDLFDLMDVTTLHDYFSQNFNRSQGSVCNEYVRWYTKLKDLDFVWADDAFRTIRDDWDHPYFLPSSEFIVPFCPSPQILNVGDERFPYKGLFISGAGARTRLHKDPWTSDALLCQFYGRKSLSLYSPDQGCCLQDGDEFVDPQNPDSAKFPRFPESAAVYQDMLEPGEVLYIAGGWFHDVTSVNDSISVTWNFVHSSRLGVFRSFVRENPMDKELDIVRFFLNPWLEGRTDADGILTFLDEQLNRALSAA